jgi:transglutaminase-like putative cysteine protease
MQLELQSYNLKDYLNDADYASFSSPLVRSLIVKFSTHRGDTVEKARTIYEFVRDSFPNTFDIGANEVSVRAEDVVRNGHGICYAKSQLLAALMRGVGIPAGYCYQLLILDDVSRPYLIIHALNAVYIEGKWIRLDARGNKNGVNAQFSLYEEKLAFPVRLQFGEIDYNTVFSEPNQKTMDALIKSKTVQQLLDNLPREL